jgi:hypothetical protein
MSKLKGGYVRENIFTDPLFLEVLNEINNTMMDYPVRNYNFHTGDDISDHSLWSGLIAKEWFVDHHPWTHGIKNSYKDIAIFACYLHDIGKVGDGDFTSLIEPGWKENHPEDGFNMLLGKEPFITASIDRKEVEKGAFTAENGEWISATKRAKYNKAGLNLHKYLLKKGFTEEEWAILAISVAMHYDFGDLLVLDTKKLGEEKYTAYLDKFFQKLEIVLSHMTDKELDVEQTLLICILVSNADLRGSNPVTWTGFGNLKPPSTKWPILPIDNYTKYNSDKNVEHKKKLLELFRHLTR